MPGRQAPPSPRKLENGVDVEGGGGGGRTKTKADKQTFGFVLSFFFPFSLFNPSEFAAFLERSWRLVSTSALFSLPPSTFIVGFAPLRSSAAGVPD